MKNILLFAVAFAALMLPYACQKDVADTKLLTDGLAATDRNATIIPAGSVNALAAALANSGTVIFEAGIHTETDPVVVTGYHQIIGLPGAVLRVGATPWVDYSLPISVALHFKNAGGSGIKGLKIEPTHPIGGGAIFIENSPKVSVQHCEINGFQYGILVEKSPQANLFDNTLAMSTGWQTGDIPEALGVTIVNGEGANVQRNEVSGALFGIWLCDKNGQCRDNYVHDSYIGIILCKVPAGGFRLPDGTLIGAEFSCQDWLLRKNNSTNNLNAGYLVIDGANHNLLENNEAANNGTYDYELVGDSYRFGFLTPFSHHNTVKVEAGDTVKDCGQNNTVTGGIHINTNTDPCN